MLELGCGAGQWSMFLAEVGAQPIGLDLSREQLAAAQRLMPTPCPLVHGDAEHLPFAASSFDIVLSDHGAISWADPKATVPEVARVLRPGGRLAFNATTAWAAACQARGGGPPSDRLMQSYFSLHRVDEGDGAATFVLGVGDWIRLLRRSGMDIEGYIELRPPAEASSAYDSHVSVEWARRWPAEAIWVATRR